MRRFYILRVFGVLYCLVFVVPLAFSQEIVLDSLCRDEIEKLVEQGATYQPGVDVHGNAVAPADLNQKINILSYPIEIPVEISLIKWMNLNVDPALRLDPEVASFTLYKDGHIEYNGQDVSDRVHLCDKRDDKEVAPAKTDGKSNGQVANDGVVSSPQTTIEPSLLNSPKKTDIDKGEPLSGEAE